MKQERAGCLAGALFERSIVRGRDSLVKRRPARANKRVDEQHLPRRACTGTTWLESTSVTLVRGVRMFWEFDAEYDRIAGDDGVVDHDEYMAAGDGGPPTNHWDGNCGAMKHGESEYWLDSDGDPSNGAEDGPYAVWYEDADGNSVDCQPPPNDGNQN